MYQSDRTNSRQICWLYLFLSGFFVGILVLNIWRDFFLQELELLNVVSLSRLRYIQIDSRAFFLYLLKERMGMSALLCLLATTYLGAAAVSAYAVYLGVMAGMVLSLASIRYGIKGIFLILVSVMPQYLLLVPACILLMVWCSQLCNILYYPQSCLGSLAMSRKQLFLQKAMQLLVIEAMILAGSAAESYINPVLLTGFLKIF